MKRLQITPLLLSLLLATSAGFVSAQNPNGNAETAAMTIKMERGEFLKMFMWDAASETWVMRAGVGLPAGVKSRAEVKAERDAFLSTNHWDDGKSRWTPIAGVPRNMSTMTREEVKAQTTAFLRTHRYDEANSKWTQRDNTGGSQ
jgi:hypothetical protein